MPDSIFLVLGTKSPKISPITSLSIPPSTPNFKLFAKAWLPIQTKNKGNRNQPNPNRNHHQSILNQRLVLMHITCLIMRTTVKSRPRQPCRRPPQAQMNCQLGLRRNQICRSWISPNRRLMSWITCSCTSYLQLKSIGLLSSYHYYFFVDVNLNWCLVLGF